MAEIVLWDVKMKREIKRIIDMIDHIQGDQGNGHPDHIHYSYEHPWYGVWFCALAKLCQDKNTLYACPQHWVTHDIEDQDDRKKQERLIPDFLLMKAAYAGDRQEITIHQIVTLIEIKRFPAEDRTEVGISDAIGTALHDLKKQIAVYFKDGDIWEDQGVKKVVGVFVAGHYWSWKLFTPDNLERAPVSDHEDPTYVPPGEHRPRYRSRRLRAAQSSA
ncbi:hypothetical protein ACEPAI_2692 [Sanghuangporus weigelae]